MLEQVVYKLKHVPSGLYYEPQGCRVNTSVLGTVYNNKPSRVSWVGFQGAYPDGYSKRYNKCSLDDWCVEKFKLIKG